MRVTSGMMSRNFLQNLNGSQENLLILQNQLSSGLRILEPSDDPSGANKVLGYKTSLSMLTQTQTNVTQASSFMGTTDSTLSDVQSMLQRAYELAVQGANDTNSSTSREDIATEVDQITKQIGTLANTKFGDRYIFNGTATDQLPVDSTGTHFSASYNPIQLDIGNGSMVNISVNGKGVFETSSSTPNGLLSSTAYDPSSGTAPTTGQTGILDTLSYELRFGDSSSISATVDKISACLDNISNVRAALGANVNRVTAISNQLDTSKNNLTSDISTTQNIDMAGAISDFQSQQNTFEAALSVGAKIIPPSLVDFLK
ncbi:flagellar hook-associated protein 3 [Desulfosporosinus acidiphilus SJ4]|uniref:Flagellar hook-associated protein 3 n=1 Tax=Desulfosporosinus acidiphilus (strain DSM 22704 / JCM 16185 / SJ4) TaxID=646529 RepID=I4DAB4_DESAJ|nr:flagellar hook-associated protein FlgL [Desulfosporosinus acidiphilus]AFM42738.1 flagellar hook-associated protein 3 [Desulfosporosinus acidiphilus SJ4]